MGVMNALWSAITTGLRLPFGVGVLGPSGIHGRTFAKRAKAIYRLAERLAARELDAAGAKEVAHEVAVQVWEHLERDPSFLDGSRPIPPIVARLTRQRLMKRGAEAGARRERDTLHTEERAASVHTWMDPDARVREAEVAELGRRAASRLSESELEVFTLSREEGLSHREIAAQLGKTVSTVRQQIMTATAVYREECRVEGIYAPPPRHGSKRTRSDAGGPEPTSRGDER